MAIVVGIDKGVRFRVFERQMLEKHFEKVYDCDIYNVKRMMAMTKAWLPS